MKIYLGAVFFNFLDSITARRTSLVKLYMLNLFLPIKITDMYKVIWGIYFYMQMKRIRRNGKYYYYYVLFINI